MDISAIRNIQSVAVSQAAQQTHVDGDSTFDSIFSTALGMLDERNKLQNTAESLQNQQKSSLHWDWQTIHTICRSHRRKQTQRWHIPLQCVIKYLRHTTAS